MPSSRRRKRSDHGRPDPPKQRKVVGMPGKEEGFKPFDDQVAQIKFLKLCQVRDNIEDAAKRLGVGMYDALEQPRDRFERLKQNIHYINTMPHKYKKPLIMILRRNKMPDINKLLTLRSTDERINKLNQILGNALNEAFEAECSPFATSANLGYSGEAHTAYNMGRKRRKRKSKRKKSKKEKKSRKRRLRKRLLSSRKKHVNRIRRSQRRRRQQSRRQQSRSQQSRRRRRRRR